MRMRLALLTHEPFFPPTGGGSAEAVYLAREFVRRGHEVHVFSPPAEDPARVEAELGVRLHPFTGWEMGRYTRLRNVKYLLYPGRLARMVEKVAAQSPFDVVLSQHAISAVAAGLLKRRLGVPVVMNFLDYLTAFMETWPVWLMPPPVLAALKRYELALPARFKADGVLTVSDVLAERFEQAGYARQRIRSLYYGYDAAAFRFDESVAAARSAGPPTVVMHGSFDHHHLGAIARGAIRRVRAERPEVGFRFVGRRTPALERLVRGLAAPAGGRPIECTGFIPYAEVARELATATVGMVPYEESTGVHCAFVAKAVEYLGLGLPTVSTPLEGLRRYFHDEPLIRFGGFDGDRLGDEILGWLKEPSARRLEWGRRASERVARNLDWPILAAAAADFVEAAAGPPQNGGT